VHNYEEREHCLESSDIDMAMRGSMGLEESYRNNQKKIFILAMCENKETEFANFILARLCICCS